MVFFELVTGRRPYTVNTPAAVLLKQATEPLPRPKDFVHNLPGEVERVIFKVLAKDPAERCKDMGAFAKVLEGLRTPPAAIGARPMESPIEAQHVASLPPELEQAINSPYAGVRAGVVPELDHLFHQEDTLLGKCSYEALQRLAQDSDPRVASASKAALETSSSIGVYDRAVPNQVLEPQSTESRDDVRRRGRDVPAGCLYLALLGVAGLAVICILTGIFVVPKLFGGTVVKTNTPPVGAV